MIGKLLCILILPYISIGIHLLYQMEVDPIEFVCHHQKQIKGDPESLFKFLTSPQSLEKLLPWLMRFKEADKRIVSAGKSYSAIIGLPFLGERKVHAILKDYRPWKLLAFEFTDDFFKQKIILQTRNYHDRTLLQATIFFRRTSLVFQYTIGYVARSMMKKELEVSMVNLARMYEDLDSPYGIPNF